MLIVYVLAFIGGFVIVRNILGRVVMHFAIRLLSADPLTNPLAKGTPGYKDAINQQRISQGKAPKYTDI